MNKPVPFSIEWDAHAHEHKERSQDWFWAVGIITVSVAIAATIFGNIIFGILILLCVFSLALFINKYPDVVHMVVNEHGITRGQVHYPYSTLESYWLDADHPHPKIILHSKKIFMPLIVVPLGDMDAVELDEVLAQFLPERYHPLPLAERVLEFLGF